jgi:hypothetical protein
MTTAQSGSAGAASTPVRKLKMAMVGIGVGGAEMLPAMEAME